MQYNLKKEEGYQREAAYYTNNIDDDRAKYYSQRAERAMDDYKTQMRYAAYADDMEVDYLRLADNTLRK